MSNLIVDEHMAGVECKSILAQNDDVMQKLGAFKNYQITKNIGEICSQASKKDLKSILSKADNCFLDLIINSVRDTMAVRC